MTIVELTFSSFEFMPAAEECPSYVEIFDDKTRNFEHTLGFFCDPKKLPTKFLSTGPEMTVYMFYETKARFVAEFSELTDFCGGNLHAPTGIVSSPGSPDTYPNNEKCTWIITSPEETKISLSYEVFSEGIRDQKNIF